MWSLTSQRVRRTSGPENFWSCARKDFFNSIGTFRTSRYVQLESALCVEAAIPWRRALCMPGLISLSRSHDIVAANPGFGGGPRNKLLHATIGRRTIDRIRLCRSGRSGPRPSRRAIFDRRHQEGNRHRRLQRRVGRGQGCRRGDAQGRGNRGAITGISDYDPHRGSERLQCVTILGLAGDGIGWLDGSIDARSHRANVGLDGPETGRWFAQSHSQLGT
jgi:hypothetical protein